jgi:hypothetical protein
MHTKIANYVLIDIFTTFTVELVCEKIQQIHQENKSKKINLV